MTCDGDIPRGGGSDIWGRRVAFAVAFLAAVVVWSLASTGHALATGAPPVAAYPFDEDEGGIARDSVGGNDAVIHGAQWTEDGRYGAALEFNGKGDYLTVTGTEALDFASDFTLEAWVRPASTASWAPLIAKEDPSSEALPFGYLLYGRGEGPGPSLYLAESESVSAHVDGPEALPTGEWSHLAVTSDGEEMRLYIDGELAEVGPAVLAKPTSGDLQIGGSPVLGQYFAGRIDEVRLYDRVLDAEEIDTDRDSGVLDGFVASISGEAAEGETLEADPGIWLGPATVTGFGYQWLLCDAAGANCEAIEGATRRRFWLPPEFVGHTLRVRVDALPGPVASVRSAPTAPVTEAKPQAEAPPAIYGRVARGRTVSATAGEWQREPAGLSYQWKLCDEHGEACEDILGAEGDQYSIPAADVGSTLVVAVTATTSGGATTALSEATEPVAEIALENTAPPSLTESGSELGTEITANPGTWTGEGEISYQYQWQRCNEGGEECEALPHETSPIFAPGTANVGSTVRISITTLDNGERQTMSSPPSAVITADEPANSSLPTISGIARTGQTLEGVGGLWTGSALTAVELQWERCEAAGEECEPLADETGNELELGDEDAGSTIRLETTAVNDFGEASAVSSATSVVLGSSGPAPTFLSPPSISGETQVGEELTGSAGVWSGAAEFEYQWERCNASGQECDAIVGAREATYAIAEEDADAALRLDVIAVAENGASTEAMATTTQSVRVVGAPVNTEPPVVEGMPKLGEALSASSGAWSGEEPSSYTYQWQACDPDGCIDIPGADEATFTLPAEEVLHEVRVLVRAKNAAGTTTAVSAPTAAVDSIAPVIVVLPEMSAASRSGQTLVAGYGSWSGEAPIGYAYRWLRCDSAGSDCSTISGEEGQSYELTGTDVGHTIRVLVTATNPAGEAEARSALSAPISASGGPSGGAPPTVSGAPEVGGLLSVDHGGWEGAESYAYQWQHCGVSLADSECALIPGATSANYAPNYDDVGSALRVTVTATGPGGSAAAVSAPTEQIRPSLEPGEESDSLLNTALPSLSGEAEDGQTLSVGNGSWSSREPVSFEYGWRRCDASGNHCVGLEGEAGPSYALSAADVGTTVRGVVRASNGTRARIVVSKASALVAEKAPSNQEPPTTSTLGGHGAIDGEVLVAATGVWTGSALSYAYQWQRCDSAGAECENIEASEAETKTYAIGAASIGSTLRVVVTATNGRGSVSAASEPTAVVAPAPPTASELPEISGESYQDGTLTATTGSWSGTPKLSYAYQWQRCNGEGKECEAIAGATSASRVASAADVGATLRVTVTATNAAGSAEATSAPSSVIGPARVPVLSGAAPTISGPAYDGRLLAASPGGWEGRAPIEFSYHWQRCNESGEECVSIGGATADTYLTGKADLGSRIRVLVEAVNGSGSASATSAPTAVVAANAPAAIEAPTIAPGVHRPGLELEVSPGAWSGSGPLEFSYRWERCDAEGKECNKIEGETKPTYTAGGEDVRKTVRAVVTAAGPLGEEDAASEAAPVLPPEAVNTEAPAVTGSDLVGSSLTASTGAWSPEADELLYQWQRCSATGVACADIAGKTSNEYTLATADAQSTIRVVVTAKNEGELEPPTAASAPTAIVNTVLPVNFGPPTVDITTPTLGEALTASPGSWSGDPTVTYSYRWQSCWAAEAWTCSDAGWNRKYYVPPFEQNGRRFRVQVTAENSHGSTVAYSAITQPASFGGGYKTPPKNLEPPKIYSGTAVVGSTLYGSDGTWSATSELRREWQRCDAEGNSCVAIPGSTLEGYAATSADVGHTLRRVVTGVNSLGEETAVSTPSEVVVGPMPPQDENAPEVSGAVEVGGALYGSAGEWSGSPDFEYEYTWKRCDAAGRNCAPLPQRTWPGSEYRPVRADVGHTLRLQVTATNGWGSVSAQSKATALVPPPPPVSNLATASWYWWMEPEVGYPFEAQEVGRWEGEPGVAYQWQRCDPLSGEEELKCEDIPKATNPKRYFPQAADVGYELRLKETATTPEEEVTAYSEPAPYPGSPRIEAGEPSYKGLAVPGQTITASSGLTVTPGLPTSTDYRFVRLGIWPPEELQDGPSPDYEIQAGDLGDWIEMQMTVTVKRADGAKVVGSRESSVITAVVEGPPAANYSPWINGEPIVGATLEAEAGEWHGGGGPLKFSYQWRRCDEEGESCTDVAGATERTYRLTSADIGARIRVAVTASSGPIETTEMSSPTSGVWAAEPLVNEEAPTIGGELVELGTAQAEPGYWSGSGPVEYEYQWQTCLAGDPESCLDIEEATTQTLPLNRAEAGQWLRVLVTASNGAGSVTAASELAGPVEHAPPPELTSAPSLTLLGPPAVGSTVMTDGGSWQNVASAELEYQWQRCDEEGEECEEIEGAEGPAYEVGEPDLGSRLQVEVTAENSSQRVSADSELSPMILEAGGAPEGAMVYLDAEREHLYVSDIEGNSPEEVADCESLVGESGCTLATPQIAPNEAIVAVEVESDALPDNKSGIVLVNIDGSESRLLAMGSSPSWSVDGTQVYYSTPDPEAPESTNIVAVNADGSDVAEPEVLVTQEGEDGSADISPDGESIVFERTEEEPHGEHSSIYLGSLGGAPKRIDLGSQNFEASDPHFTVDGQEILFTAVAKNPKMVSYGGEEVGLYGLHRLWAMNANGTNPHPIVPDEAATYSAPNDIGDEILVTHETATWVSTGGGGFVEYSDPKILRINRRTGRPRSQPIPGVEPNSVATASSEHVDVHDCPQGESVCYPWGNDQRDAAAEYAEKWSYKGKFNPAYWNIPDNCTNFMSQSWHKAGQFFQDEWTRDETYYPFRWWANKGRGEEWSEMNDSNYGWSNVNGFLASQTGSGRARNMHHALAPEFRKADVILLNWLEHPGESELNHAVIVTAANGANEKFVSSQTAARHRIPWHFYYTEIVPKFFKEHRAEYPTEEWTWDLLRPEYRASNHVR